MWSMDNHSRQSNHTIKTVMETSKLVEFSRESRGLRRDSWARRIPSGVFDENGPYAGRLSRTGGPR